MSAVGLKAGPIPDGSRLLGWIPGLTEVEIASFGVYLRELVRFNKTLNLVSGNTISRADAVHVADAVLAWRIISREIPSGSVVTDLGSGNGVPGLIFATLAGDRKFRVVDRDTRKIEFMKHAGAAMGLKNVAFVAKDVGDLEPDSIPFAVSRGFAPVGKALLLSRRSIGSGGRFFMMKSDGWAKEVADVPSQLFMVWDIKMVGQYRLPENDGEYVVIDARKK